MSLAFEMRLYGIDALNAALRRLPRTTRRKFIRRGMRSAAKVYLAEAKRQVPVDTGKLKRSLKVRAMKKSRTHFGFMVRTGTRKELGIPDDAKGYYPAAIEYGYEKNGVAHLPNAFMRRSFDGKQNEMRSAMTDSIWNDLREAVQEVRAA